MKYEENHLANALDFRNSALREAQEEIKSMTPEQLEQEERENRKLLQKILDQIATDSNTEIAIDERKLSIFKLHAECARTLARDLELDASIKTRGNKGVIQLFSDMLLLEFPVDKWLIKQFQSLVMNADSMSYEIVDRYGEKVICMNFYYDLSEEFNE